jgi:hypothetical protein
MRRFRWTLRTVMIATAVVAALMTGIVENRRRSSEPYRKFHAGKADYFRRLAIQSRRDSEFAEQRALLGAPSMTPEGNFYEVPRLLSPGEWAEFQAKCEKNAALFDMMAEQHARWLGGYERSVHLPWQPTPQDPHVEADLSK